VVRHRPAAPGLRLVSMAAFPPTLILICAFRAGNITSKTLQVALIAGTILIAVCFNSSLTNRLMADSR
jgi:ACR3 family arsenite efflux pump ArsB